ncbi:BQ2448_6698 [Microbotryum intermedium]|uniref:BQ2448_6698 protein n=1 Tax=Microbotryum intermedium TaxID=269621 RepID=A0A238FT34_9BASI|nr:BQ2448_6698 [Microbotryum intermedium]
MAVNAVAGPSRPRVNRDLPMGQPGVERRAAHPRQSHRGSSVLPSAETNSGTEPQSCPAARDLSRCRRCLLILAALSSSTSLVVVSAAVLPARGLAHASGARPRALIIKPDLGAEVVALPYRPIGADRAKTSSPLGTPALEQYHLVPNKPYILAPSKPMIDLRHLCKPLSTAGSCLTHSSESDVARAQTLVQRGVESSSTAAAEPAIYGVDLDLDPVFYHTQGGGTAPSIFANTEAAAPKNLRRNVELTRDSEIIKPPRSATLGTNFTSTACPSFFRTFLANPAFIACTPFSLLIGTSNGFFMAARSPYALLPTVLDAACAAPLGTCTTLMNQLAGQLAKAENCGNDLSRRNPLVLEALEGFQNYAMMYQAGCQRNNVTAQYCFAEANVATDPSALYYYYLPEGTTLPSGTVPECGSCTQGLMDTYDQYARNSTYVISQTYGGARTQTALACGPNFAPLVAVASTSAATPQAWSVSASTSPLLLFVVLVTSFYCVLL